ncbi:MAG TPA: hypothetical protein VJ276_20930 [Thermoanaerobaculia bacterium]|nr:hypothetical protein [Thermoanaerobaculia bacterium]
MQHVMVVLDENEKPVAEPFEVNLWTDDRLVMWMMNAPGWQWSNLPPPNGAGPNQAVFIDPNSDWFKQGGSQPQPVGPLVAGLPDTRPYAAMGPAPATEKTTYLYDMWALPIPIGDITDQVKAVKVKKKLPKGVPSVGDPIDPDISNQPHPP